jgi:hypothetical protein
VGIFVMADATAISTSSRSGDRGNHDPIQRHGDEEGHDEECHRTEEDLAVVPYRAMPPVAMAMDNHAPILFLVVDRRDR